MLCCRLEKKTLNELIFNTRGSVIAFILFRCYFVICKSHVVTVIEIVFVVILDNNKDKQLLRAATFYC